MKLDGQIEEVLPPWLTSLSCTIIELWLRLILMKRTFRFFSDDVLYLSTLVLNVRNGHSKSPKSNIVSFCKVIL